MSKVVFGAAEGSGRMKYENRWLPRGKYSRVREKEASSMNVQQDTNARALELDRWSNEAGGK